jgi:hypothetical protein
MHSLDLQSVPAWTVYQERWVPQSVDTSCPHCGRLVTFAQIGWIRVAQVGVFLSSINCPGCRKDVMFFVVHPGPAGDASKKGCECLGMFPAPKGPRKETEGIDLVPQRIRKAYRETLSVFNAGVWPATATLARRTLEGIIGEFLGPEERKGTLEQQLKSLAETKSNSLALPLITLSHSLRQGGNLGAHFDDEKDPDAEMAEAMLDLIEYLIQYVYALPEMIKRLDDKIGPPAQSTSAP